MPRTPDASPQTLRVFSSLMDDPQSWHYGYGLSKQTGLAPGTLYPILARLVDRDLLEARWEPSDQPGRPPRHLYRLTAEGAQLAQTRLAAAATAATAESGAPGTSGAAAGGLSAGRPGRRPATAPRIATMSRPATAPGIAS